MSYSFVDTVAGQGGSAGLPSEAMKYNGVYLENEIPGYRTLYVQGRELMGAEVRDKQITGLDGSVYYGKTYPPRTIVVGYQLIAASKGGSTTGQTQTGASGWIQVSDTQWQYKKADGTLCRSEWLDLNGTSYWFDDNTYMATGWRQFSNGAWYYFNPQNGAMVTNKWVTDNGKSYYLQSDGTMAVNTVIDGTYQVDANGVYVKKLK